ncbi:GNAT family N-acetyltransferase [Halorussus aquaticus]|uniref:GNAT family N-acetyltransferase n=1 Tax=Halorussus aquaticus TaxID=2953748 RepID=A0ABD5Q6N0_9EURY|nr:GNAT family N-acetyltransferase [Halorussus aquaticus]
MVRITCATADDRLGVRRVLDAAMLDVREDLRDRIDAGDVLVADGERRDSENRAAKPRDAEGGDSPILGALVLVGGEDGSSRIDAVAVRRARRERGIGSALVRAAAERRAPLTAEFDPGVRPFYEALGFEISPVEDDGERLRGRYDADERA